MVKDKTNLEKSTNLKRDSKNSGFAVTALILGICALVLFWLPFIGWIFWVAAVIFGILGIIDSGKPGKKGKGLAIAGLILGIVAFLLYLIIVFVIGIMFLGSMTAMGR